MNVNYSKCYFKKKFKTTWLYRFYSAGTFCSFLELHIIMFNTLNSFIQGYMGDGRAGYVKYVRYECYFMKPPVKEKSEIA